MNDPRSVAHPTRYSTPFFTLVCLICREGTAEVAGAGAGVVAVAGIHGAGEAVHIGVPTPGLGSESADEAADGHTKVAEIVAVGAGTGAGAAADAEVRVVQCPPPPPPPRVVRKLRSVSLEAVGSRVRSVPIGVSRTASFTLPAAVLHQRC